MSDLQSNFPVSFPDPQARIASLERELAWAHLKIQSLVEELRQFRVKMLGPKSETLSDLQLELLAEEEPSATSDEVAAEAKREAMERESKTLFRQLGRHLADRWLPGL